MNDNISFEHKLKVTAKAFFRDRTPEDPWQCWQDVYREMKDTVSDIFIETCYEMNKNDPELNSEAMN